jgi:hypothetical protein
MGWLRGKKVNEKMIHRKKEFSFSAAGASHLIRMETFPLKAHSSHYNLRQLFNLIIYDTIGTYRLLLTSRKR